jgi:tetratricopeptide (TPR) repeat protein
MNRHERRAAARQSKKPSENAGASTPDALCESGRQHMQAGRYLDAQLCCQQALMAAPDHAEALHLMGLLCLRAEQYDHAIEWLFRATQREVKAEYLSSLGKALTQQGRHNEALKAFDVAVRVQPTVAELWMDHAEALVKLERESEAVLSCQRALELSPNYLKAAATCGILLRKLNRPDEALFYFNLTNELCPDHATVLRERGLALHDLGRFAEALADNRRAYELDPNNPKVCNNIGASLQLLCQDEEALRWFEKAIELQPDFIVALTNKAMSLSQIRRLDEAFATFHHLKTIDPGNSETELSLSYLHLMTGNFEVGWSQREARWDTRFRSPIYPNFTQPMWRGDESIEGKTILIQVDEGLGDTIQYARYMPMLAERGAKVVLVVEDAIYPLLSGLEGVSQCFPRSIQSLPAFDLHCPICSLPLAFRTRLETIPSGSSYLPRPSQSRVQAWEERLQGCMAPGRKLRVGLVWSGNAKHVNDHNRSIPLQMLSRLLDVDASFLSLQKDPRPADRALLEQSDIVDLTSHFTDFAETAALVSCLDLVITVDTSVAHLAAALGCPTWILLPYMPDFRWLLDRDDSPWYPTARLFRQTGTRDYGEVLDRVHSELVALSATVKARNEQAFLRSDCTGRTVPSKIVMV